jgi:3-hydroxyisobutyrate dehydrogenase-like beta-hydroxyacid dehydrogenase
VAVAQEVAATGYRGVYVDANAVSPETARTVSDEIERAGATYVDGGIIGGPPVPDRPASLFLSGPRAGDIATMFADTPLRASALDGQPFGASAVKMCFAAYTKGTTALLIAIRTLARTHGVDEALVAQWERSQPGLAAGSAAQAASAAAKAWRWVGEMEEIAATFAAAGLPSGFHDAAAEVYRRVGGRDDHARDLDEMTACLAPGAVGPVRVTAREV